MQLYPSDLSVTIGLFKELKFCLNKRMQNLCNFALKILCFIIFYWSFAVNSIAELITTATEPAL